MKYKIYLNKVYQQQLEIQIWTHFLNKIAVKEVFYHKI